MTDPYAGIAVLDRNGSAAEEEADPYASIAVVANEDARPLNRSAAPVAAKPEQAAPPPYDPSGTGDIGFASSSAADSNSRPEGSDAYVREVYAGVKDGSIASADDLTNVANKYGFSFPDRSELEATFAALRKGATFGGVNPAEYAVDISEDRGKSALGDTAKAFIRGIPAVVGLDDEVNAAADTLLNGEDWTKSLANERAIRNYDEDNHFWARLGGELIGGVGIDAGIARVAPQLTARAAARAAATEAMRNGATRDQALATAQRVFTLRSAQEGAVYGGAFGAGDADGDFGDRVLGGVSGSIVGGVTGGLVAKGGSRIARVLAERARLSRTAGAYEAQGALLAAERQGIDLLPQDVGGEGLRRATQGASQTMFGAPLVRGAADRLYGGFSSRVGEVGGVAETAADVGGALKGRSEQLAAREGGRAAVTSQAVQDALGVPVDQTGAGQIVQRGVARFLDDTAERANQLYARVPIPDASDASVVNTRGALRDLTAGMRSNAELSALFESPRLTGYLTALTPRLDPESGETLHAGTLSWGDLQQFRTRVGDMLDDPRLSEKIAPRQLRALYGALSQDMEATARSQGEPALRAWRRANGYYNGRMNRINSTLSLVVGERRDRNPERSYVALASNAPCRVDRRCWHLREDHAVDIAG